MCRIASGAYTRAFLLILCIAPDFADWMVEQRGFEPPAPTTNVLFSRSGLLVRTRRQHEFYHQLMTL
jgi:hypothetical protein